MALSPTDQTRTGAAYQRMDLCPGAITKAQLAAAIAAADAWMDSNQAAYVAALPAQFRNNTTAAQKAELFALVLMRRIGRLPVGEDS